MTATLPKTSGGEVFIRWPIAGSKFASFSTSFVRSTMPSLPNDDIGLAGLRVERDQLVTRRDGENPGLAVRRSSTTTPRLFLRTPFARAPFVEPPYPERFAGARVGRDDRPADRRR